MDELLGAAPPAEGSNEPAESSCQSEHALLSPNLCSAEHTESCRSRCLMVMKEIKTGPERTVRGKKICLAMEKDVTHPAYLCLA